MKISNLKLQTRPKDRLFSTRLMGPNPAKRMDPPKKMNDKLKIITKELSPRTIRKNISIENFMKYQWSWTL